MPAIRPRSTTIALAAWSLAWAVGPLGPRAMAGATAVPSDPTFIALMTDGSTASGQVRRLGLEEGLVLAGPDGQDRTIPVDRLVKLTREGASPPSTSEGGLVLFPDGDRLARSVIGSAGEFNLDIQSFSMGNLSIPLDSILGLLLDPPSDTDAVDALVSRVRGEPREAELLWLKNGDKLPGVFVGMGDKKLAFQPATGKVDFDRSGVVALGFAPG